MAPRANRGTFRLRMEPYDPDAVDADNDGIVQEGTAWERPAGTRMVDAFLNEIKRGMTSTQRSSQFRVVDRSGRPVRYVPTYDRGIDPMRGRQVQQFTSALGPNLRERGLRLIGEGRTLGDLYKASRTPPDIPEVDPEIVARADRFTGLINYFRGQPAFGRSDSGMPDMSFADKLIDDPRGTLSDIDSASELMGSLLSHKFGQPDDALQGVDVDGLIMDLDTYMTSRFGLPSTIKRDELNNPNNRFELRTDLGDALNQIELQRLASRDLSDRLQAASTALRTDPETLDSEQARALHATLTSIRDTTFSDIPEVYQSIPVSPQTRLTTRLGIEKAGMEYVASHQEQIKEQLAATSRRIADLDTPQQQNNAPDLTPGMIPTITGGLATRELDPRLGTVAQVNGMDIMPSPTFKAADSDMKFGSVEDAINHVRQGGSLSDVPSLMWRDVLNGASSESDIDTSLPFHRHIPVEGANGDVSIFRLRDKDGNPTNQGWVIKGSLTHETDREIIGWNLAAAHGISPSGAGYDGEGELTRGVFNGEQGDFAIIPFAFSHVDASSPKDIDAGSRLESAYSPDRLKETDLEGNPQLFGAFLHSYLCGLTDRHNGNTLSATHDGQAIVMPIDMASAGRNFGGRRVDDPFSYAHFEYGSDTGILERLAEYRKGLSADDAARFDAQITDVYDSILERAEAVSALDTTEFADRILSGRNPRRTDTDEARNMLESTHSGYRANVEQMAKSRDDVLSSIIGSVPPRRTKQDGSPNTANRPASQTPIVSPGGEKVVQRNQDVADQISALGGSPTGDIDDAFREKNEPFGLAHVKLETKDEAYERRRQRLVNDFAEIRQAIQNGGIETGSIRTGMVGIQHGSSQGYLSPQMFAGISPEVRELIATKSDDELIEIMERRALEFQQGLDKRVRVNIEPARLFSMASDGRYKTTHEAKSVHSGPQIRAQYEVHLGIPADAPAELRPASGYVVHPDWEATQIQHVQQNAPTTSAEDVRRNLYSGINLNPNGHVGIYGAMEIVLVPEVAGRTRYGRGDSLTTALQPVAMESSDPREIMHAISWAGGNSDDESAKFTAALLQSEVDGHFGNLNLYHPQFTDEGTRDLSNIQRGYFEALIGGSFDMSDIETVRMPTSQLEVIGKLDEDLSENVVFQGLANADRLRAMGFSEDEIAYIMSNKNNYMFKSWFQEYVTWKRRERGGEKLDALGINVEYIHDIGGGKDMFQLSSYRGSEGAESIEELMAQRARQSVIGSIEAQKRQDAINAGLIIPDEEESVS